MVTTAELLLEQGKQLTAVTKELAEVRKSMANTPAFDPRGAVGDPAKWGSVRTWRGERPMTERGYSFMKMLGLARGWVKPENAKVEMDMHRRLDKAVCGCAPADAYNYSGAMPGQTTFMAPLGSKMLHDDFVDREFRYEMKSLVEAGVDGADPDEMSWIERKMGRKDLSWLNELAGGALVKPAEQGELIELLRNKEALINAGARVVPLPPQGRIKYPRQTMASLTFWVGENSGITASDIGTGEVNLQAKKLCVLIKAPNELVRFASPAAEALIRDDMTKSLALGLDLAGLEGKGTDNEPEGLIFKQNINKITSTINNVGGGGDQIVGQDLYRLIAAIEESNQEFEGLIMRPKTLYRYYQLRADAVGQGDKAGPFLFNLIREAGDGFLKPTLAGYPVTKSTQVSQSRSQGTKSNLTYILGGAFSDVLIGMFGAIEFAATTMGDTPFIKDQTWVRGILSADINIRHEASMVLLDNLDPTI